ncbi:MAG: GNAT family N-acetyltransferase [FCB group bacterium]|nr:GNAT family N-acetyltransferase [FCB group bacterium]
MSIRRATINDLPEIDSIEQRVFDDAWPREEIGQVLSDAGGIRTWVLEREHTVIGYLMVHEGADTVHILNFAIDIPWQHQGFGKQLLTSVLRKFPETSKVELEVKRSNWPAIQLYLNAGFIPQEVRPRYYPDGEDALIFRKCIHHQQETTSELV